MSNLTIMIAVLFLAMGLGALVAPARVLAIFGVPALTIDGRNEVRAVYGGYGVAMSGVLLLALTRPALRPGVLACVAVALAGMAAGRLVAAAVDGLPGPYPRLFFVVELVGAAALTLALVRAW